MKAEVKPAMAVAVIVLILIVAGFFVYRGAQGDTGAKAPGQVGNASPFAPGGSVVNKGARPAQASPDSQRPPGMPR